MKQHNEEMKVYKWLFTHATSSAGSDRPTFLLVFHCFVACRLMPVVMMSSTYTSAAQAVHIRGTHHSSRLGRYQMEVYPQEGVIVWRVLGETHRHHKDGNQEDSRHINLQTAISSMI